MSVTCNYITWPPPYQVEGYMNTCFFRFFRDNVQMPNANLEYLLERHGQKVITYYTESIRVRLQSYIILFNIMANNMKCIILYCNTNTNRVSWKKTVGLSSCMPMDSCSCCRTNYIAAVGNMWFKYKLDK